MCVCVSVCECVCVYIDTHSLDVKIYFSENCLGRQSLIYIQAIHVGVLTTCPPAVLTRFLIIVDSVG